MTEVSKTRSTTSILIINSISSAIKKLQRVKSIVVPRVNAGGLPFFLWQPFGLFEMKQLHLIIALRNFMLNADERCLQKMSRKNFRCPKHPFINSCFFLSELSEWRDLPLSLHVVCSKSCNNLKNYLIAEHIIINH